MKNRIPHWPLLALLLPQLRSCCYGLKVFAWSPFLSGTFIQFILPLDLQLASSLHWLSFVTSFPNHPVWSSHPITPSLLSVFIFCTAFSLLILSFALFTSLLLVSTSMDVELVDTMSCYMRNWSIHGLQYLWGSLELIPNRHWRMMVYASFSCHPSLLCAKNSAWKIVGDQ